MLRCLTVNNFRCYERFEFTFPENDRSLLFLGRNGAGKTTFADSLEIFQKIGRGDGRVGRLVSQEPRWDKSKPVEFALSVELAGTHCEYGFSLEFPNGFSEFRIVSEELKVDGKFVYSRKGAVISFDAPKDEKPHDAGDKNKQLSYDWHVLFLPTYFNTFDNSLQSKIDAFRSWLANILILSPYPAAFNAKSDPPARWPERDCANCASWLAYLLGNRPRSYADVEDYLKCLWDDFYTVAFPQEGSLAKHLKLEFKENEKEFSPSLEKLSDGQKCLFLSAIVIAALEASPSALVFWDEPDSYLALSEIEHFIRALRSKFRKNGQLLLTSHHPETIASFSDETTFIFDRANNLSPTQPLATVSQLRDANKFAGDFIPAYRRGDLAAW